MQTDLSHVPIGESAIILGFSDEEISLKLIELGCIPGTQITMIRKAPFGDVGFCMFGIVNKYSYS